MRKHGLAARFFRFVTTNSTEQAPPLTQEDFDRNFRAVKATMPGAGAARSLRRQPNPLHQSHPPSWGSE